MAKRKTPKVDLKPRAEKITDQQLEKLQSVVKNINKAQQEIGVAESRKHELLHLIFGLNDSIREMQTQFVKEYGSDEINIADGTIKYNENGIDKAN